MAEKQRLSEVPQGSCDWRAIEFFAGIGGFACAWPECSNITAIDIDTQAREIYQLNWPHSYLTREISTLTARELLELNANLWWLSPPCQPYSCRGKQRDIDDPRAASLLHLISLVPKVRPRAIVLENVWGFRSSRARALLEGTLTAQNYHLQSCELCPTEMGWPNRRPRFYLIASQEPIKPWQATPDYSMPLNEVLRHIEVDGLAYRVSSQLIAQYERAIDRVDLADDGSIAACFGSSYGKSIARAGSYVKSSQSWRRFAPLEVARLLGFPDSFTLPDQCGHRRAWSLLGNSLSILAVRYILSHLPGGPAPSTQIHPQRVDKVCTK